MPDKSACALNARKGGPKGERSESSKALKSLDPGIRRDDGKGIDQSFPNNRTYILDRDTATGTLATSQGLHICLYFTRIIQFREAIMGDNTRMHDGIAGALILVGTLLGYFVNPYWLAVPGVISALMLQSAFSGFCPVYFTLGKLRGTHKTAET